MESEGFTAPANHEHRPRVLSVDAARAQGFPFLRQVSGVTNDAVGDLPAAEVRLNIGADLHLEVVEPLMKRFEHWAMPFVVIIPQPAS